MIPPLGGNTESHWKFSSPTGKKTKTNNTTTTTKIHDSDSNLGSLMSYRWIPNEMSWAICTITDSASGVQSRPWHMHPVLNTADFSSTPSQMSCYCFISDQLKAKKCIGNTVNFFKLASQFIIVFYIYLIPPPKLYDQDYKHACTYFSLIWP